MTYENSGGKLSVGVLGLWRRVMLVMTTMSKATELGNKMSSIVKIFLVFQLFIRTSIVTAGEYVG